MGSEIVTDDHFWRFQPPISMTSLRPAFSGWGVATASYKMVLASVWPLMIFNRIRKNGSSLDVKLDHYWPLFVRYKYLRYSHLLGKTLCCSAKAAIYTCLNGFWLSTLCASSGGARKRLVTGIIRLVTVGRMNRLNHPNRNEASTFYSIGGNDVFSAASVIIGRTFAFHRFDFHHTIFSDTNASMLVIVPGSSNLIYIYHNVQVIQFSLDDIVDCYRN